MDQGYIKLYRSIKTWEWYRDANTKTLFLHLLLSANHAANEWQGLTIEPGQLVTSVAHLADDLLLTPKKIRRALNNLKRTGEVAIETTNRYSLITLTNWASYQRLPAEGASETASAGADKGQTKGKQRATNKNDKNEKKVKNTYSADFESFWTAYPRSDEKPGAYRCWLTRLKEGHVETDLISAAQRYAAECTGNDKQFIKLAKTFLGPNKPFLDHIGPSDPDQPLSVLPEDAEAPWQIIEDALNQDGET